MKARSIVSAGLICIFLLWGIVLIGSGAALAGAPEAVDIDQGFGEVAVQTPSSSSSSSVPSPSPSPPSPVSEGSAAPARPAVAAIEISPFKAFYDVKMKGVVVAELEVSLAKEENGDWIYRQKSTAKGVAALFGPEDLVETSRFRREFGQLKVLEYRSKRKGGDADDNARFVFDHAIDRVESVGKGAPWSVDAPKDVVDPLLMTLAMRFDLVRDKVGEGATTGSSAAPIYPTYRYSVPRQGRIKIYEFGVVGVETLEVTGRTLSTVHVQRFRDKKDQTSIWTAPSMDYLPVRILKTRKEGSSSEVLLRSFVRS